jgi:ELWxxDGT repeat protein
LIPVGERLYFTASTNTTGREWFSVGPNESTATSHEVVPGIGAPDDLEVGAGWEGWFYFLADDGSGLQIWRTSGATVEVVTGFAEMSTSETDALVPGPGGLYFAHDDDPTGVELWRTDGISTVLVADVDLGGDSYPSLLTLAGGYLYFEAGAAGTGHELYRTTGVGAELVADLYPGHNSSSLADLVAAGDRLVFAANDGVGGQELWITRGDGAGVVRLPEAWPGLGGTAPRHLAVAPDGSRVVFSGVTLATGREPFVADIRLFADGFESGSSAAWSSTVP